MIGKGSGLGKIRNFEVESLKSVKEVKCLFNFYGCIFPLNVLRFVTKPNEVKTAQLGTEHLTLPSINYH